ncbi:MAG TPA: hypothetical protein VF592_00795 [Sphingomonas sp.]|jgi:outer membrane immunogenic protein|uniref:outer membrane protein n=1 Tax=Sphingomonas sp. TaxID=28214 RepID=UPI002ED890F5
MRHTLLTGLAGLSFALGAPALAQDMGTAVADPATQTAPAPYEPAAPAAYEPAVTTTADPATEDAPFSGLYVGGSFGGAVQPGDGGSFIRFDRGLDGNFGDTVTTGAGANAFGAPVGGFCSGAATTATSLTSPAGGFCSKDRDGIEYYGKVGFDVQAGKIVFGALGEFGRAEIRDSVSAFSTTPAAYILTRKIEWEATARARLGFVAGRSTLFYGTGGGGYVSLDRDFRSIGNSANAFEVRGKRRQFGFVAGGGVEQMIGNNFSIGLEYLFHQYQDKDTRGRVTQGTAPSTNPFVANGSAGTDFRRSDPRFSWHSLRATAALRF